jgi:FkbM family methyltransferase
MYRFFDEQGKNIGERGGNIETVMQREGFNGDVFDPEPYLHLNHVSFIHEMYRIMLGREADDEGFGTISGFFQRTGSIEALVCFFQGSAEFGNRFEVKDIDRYRKAYKKCLQKIKLCRLPIVGAYLKSRIHKRVMLDMSNCILHGTIGVKHRIEQVNHNTIQKLNSLRDDILQTQSAIRYEFLKHQTSVSDGLLKHQTSVRDELIRFQSHVRDELIGFQERARDYLLYSQRKIGDEILQNEKQLFKENAESQIRIHKELERDINAIPKAVSAIGDLAVVLLDGFIFGILNGEWRMAAYMNYRGYPEPGSVKIFKEIVKPGMTVLDIGANYGIYTLLAARLTGMNGKVWAIEPTPKVRYVLENNIQVNGFKETGIVTVCPVAASDVNQIMSFSTSNADSGHNSLFPESYDCEMIEVDVVRLDDYLDDVLKADVIKLDVEGAEPNALRGLSRIIQNSPGLKVLMEWAPVNLSRNDVDTALMLEDIRKQGFTISVINEGTGMLQTQTDEQLLSAYSINLLLEK